MNEARIFTGENAEDRCHRAWAANGQSGHIFHTKDKQTWGIAASETGFRKKAFELPEVTKQTARESQQRVMELFAATGVVGTTE